MTSRTIPSRPWPAPSDPLKSTRHQVPDVLIDALWARCGGLCEACGQPFRGVKHPHHRKRRGQGGDDSPGNVILVHPLCHRRIHSNTGWSYETGFLVKPTQQPGRIRLALHGERWVRLARDGSYVEAA